ncbi:phytase [Massilia sp. YIM B02763]|uniref:phytase n=1 Tax=Massilia sp. YIM B02763 TaxID=3050130 RepID=UPI0025B6459C|nr:phytase [Massilia sp. YIM B02763]MDN4053048.1 phytase [Massilia sp. YIM B02763]
MFVSLLAAAFPVLAQQVPSALATAGDVAALPGGAWLALDKRALRLVGPDGAERASLALRPRQFDVRAGAGGALVLVVDANTERALPVIADTADTADAATGTLRALPALPETGFGIEAACLYRDAQRLDHAFLVAKDGQAQQWLLGPTPRLVRHLALPPGVKHCRVDDATATLYVGEAGLGLWAYDADPESGGTRRPVDLRAPFGKLAGGAGAIAVLPGGVAALDAKGTLHAWRHVNGAWQAQAPLAIQANGLAAGAPLLAHAKDGWRPAGLAWTTKEAPARTLPIVTARAQTEPVARAGDAADDPAIWVHPSDPGGARVLGTNKKQGLLVYDLQGRQLQLLESGRLNNVDVRQDLRFGAERFDLAMATQRDENAMVLFAINATGKVAEAARIPTPLDDIYGACLYRTPQGGLDAFVNDKDGRYLHYRITRAADRFGAELKRSFRLASQPEGCVADDRTGLLFMGEEDRGVWVADADASRPAVPRMVLPVGDVLHADVEGMGIYHGSKGNWLVVSSQGNNSYVVLDAAPPFRVRGAFRIGIDAQAGIDGASETDGLDVTSARLGGPYAKGLLVVQDGHKRLPDGPQNFKLVAWEDVERALKLE